MHSTPHQHSSGNLLITTTTTTNHTASSLDPAVPLPSLSSFSSTNPINNFATTTTSSSPANNNNNNNNNMVLYGMTPEQASREFDILRREATKLERLLEDKVAKYQQLAQRISISGDTKTTSTTSRNSYPSSSHPRNSLLSLDHVESGIATTTTTTTTTQQHLQQRDNDNEEEEEEQLSQEISRLLSHFTELLNTRMAPASEQTGRSQHSLLVKRYREILFDSSSEYYKTMEVVRRKKETRELLYSGRRRDANNNNSGGGSGVESAAETESFLFRERSSIDASLNSTNALLNQASSVRKELRTQGQNLRNVSNTMSVIVGNIPSLNGLMEMIRKKRSRDDRIVSGVVAGCILFTLWYLFG